MKPAFAGALLVLGLSVSVLACADWSVFGDLEHFRWREETSPSVTETGPMLGLGLRWRQERPAGFGLGFESRVYGGSVDYDGSLLFSGTPITGTTQYGGWRNELQANYRFPGSPGELVLGLGYDYWNRQLTFEQHEEYSVAYLRLGFDVDRREPGAWFGGGGFKYPFSVDENAHFPDLGFTPNPRLKPKGEASLYAELGYRFAPAWSLAGYYEGYRFGESGDVLVSDGTSTSAFFQPKSSLDSFGLRLRYSF
ncbi:MAG TPA: hypothetical protein VFI80_12100 [Burkholderiales bacterium]|nr:hypothetical protein [Burkholderiales bacterium]